MYWADVPKLCTLKSHCMKLKYFTVNDWRYIQEWMSIWDMIIQVFTVNSLGVTFNWTYCGFAAKSWIIKPHGIQVNIRWYYEEDFPVIHSKIHQHPLTMKFNFHTLSTVRIWESKSKYHRNPTIPIVYVEIQFLASRKLLLVRLKLLVTPELGSESYFLLAMKNSCAFIKKWMASCLSRIFIDELFQVIVMKKNFEMNLYFVRAHGNELIDVSPCY